MIVPNTQLHVYHFHFAVTDWNTSERLISEPYFLKTGLLHTAHHCGILSCSDKIEMISPCTFFIYVEKISRLNFRSFSIELKCLVLHKSLCDTFHFFKKSTFDFYLPVLLLL